MRTHVSLCLLVTVLVRATSTQAVPDERQLPFMANETWWCSQDWFGSYSHGNEKAWDFNWSGNDLGMPLLAPADGRIEFAGDTQSDYGIVVLIAYGDGSFDRIAHCQSVVVKEREYVKQGQVVAFCGSSGSSAVHVHINAQSSASPGAYGASSIDSDFDFKQGSTITEDGHPEGCDCWSTSDPQYYYTSLNSNIVDLRKEASLNDRNPYGWSQTPDQAFGDEASPPGALYEIGWYHEYNPSTLYAADGTAKNCYRAIYSGSSAGAAIVYDALGGARFAYVVGWEKWEDWNELPISCGSCPNPAGGNQQYEGGPNSCLGMPITNSYRAVPNEEIWRQDFQKGYIVNGEIYCYPYHSPGMTSGDEWSHQYSYLFADAYDRNGGARDVGNAIYGSNGLVHVLSGNILIQDFSGGNDGDGMIMYDTENWDGNSCASNEAYWLYGDIKARYDNNGGVSQFGCATIDRFQDAYGRWCQDFKKGNDFFRIFESGSEEWTELSSPCAVYAQGGVTDPDPSFDAILVRRIDSETYEWRVCVSNGSSAFGQETVWKSDFGSDDNQYYLGDFNGDSYADILAIETISSSIMKLRVATSNGVDAFVYQGIWSDDFGSSNSKYIIGDFNGDGKDDVAHCTYDTYDHSIVPIRVTLSDGNSFGSSVEWSEDFGSISSRWYAGDFNGDGKDDICYNFDQTSSIIPWRVALSTGSAFGSSELWYDDFGNAGQVYLVGDFTGDGKCDAAHSLTVTESQIKWYVAASTGSSFGTSTVWSTDFGALGSEYFAGYVKNNDAKADMANVLGSGSTYAWHVMGSSGSGFGTPTSWKSDFGDSADQFFLANVAPNSEYSAKVVAPEAEVSSVPRTFTLHQNYPNPFNASTVIGYEMPEAGRVRVEVFNILGQRVETLIDEIEEAGTHQLTWDAKDRSSGIYFYRIQTPSATEAKKMVLVK